MPGKQGLEVDGVVLVASTKSKPHHPQVQTQGFSLFFLSIFMKSLQYLCCRSAHRVASMSQRMWLT